jgi:hypothetical protein
MSHEMNKIESIKGTIKELEGDPKHEEKREDFLNKYFAVLKMLSQRLKCINNRIKEKGVEFDLEDYADYFNAG